MSPLAARISQGLKMLQDFLAKMDADGELQVDEIDKLITYFETFNAALQYELECRQAALDSLHDCRRDRNKAI